MPRKWSKSVPEGNGPVLHHDEFESREPTMVGLYRMIEELSDKSDSNLEKRKSRFEQQDEKLDELTKKVKETRQRLAGLEHDARQPGLATGADVPTDKKTRKRMEDAAADQAKHGDSYSAKRVDVGPTTSTSFGMTAKPSALPRRDDVLVDESTELPK